MNPPIEPITLTTEELTFADTVRQEAHGDLIADLLALKASYVNEMDYSTGDKIKSLLKLTQLRSVLGWVSNLPPVVIRNEEDTEKFTAERQAAFIPGWKVKPIHPMNLRPGDFIASSETADDPGYPVEIAQVDLGVVIWAVINGQMQYWIMSGQYPMWHAVKEDD